MFDENSINGYASRYSDGMEYEIKELNIEALRREILRKCKKGTGYSTPRDKAKGNEQWQEDIQKKDIVSIKTDEIAEEELPLEEVLTERRRKYVTKEEFVHLLYNDILPPFIAE